MLQSQQMQNRQLQDQIQQLQAMQTKVQEHQASVTRTLQHQQLQQQQEGIVLQPSPGLNGSGMKYVDIETPITVQITILLYDINMVSLLICISTSPFQKLILAKRHSSRSRGPGHGHFRPAAESPFADAPSGFLFLCVVLLDCVTDGSSSTTPRGTSRV